MAYEDGRARLLRAEWAQNQSSQWRHYRGGRTHPIRVINLADHSVEKLPWTDSNDTLADVDRRHRSTSSPIATAPPTCSATGSAPSRVTQLTRHDDFDIMSASAGPDAIVYEQAGYIHCSTLAIEAGAAAQRSR